MLVISKILDKALTNKLLIWRYTPTRLIFCDHSEVELLRGDFTYFVCKKCGHIIFPSMVVNVIDEGEGVDKILKE